MSIMAQAYSPLLGYQGEIGGLLHGRQARLPERPPMPQVQVGPPNYQALAGADRQGGMGSSIGSILGLAGALAGSWATGGLSLGAYLTAAGAGSALGGTVGGQLD